MLEKLPKVLYSIVIRPTEADISPHANIKKFGIFAP